MLFSDVAASAGVLFTYRNGEEAEQFSIAESLGGGVAVLDYDVDGMPDLFFPGGGCFPGAERIEGLPGALFHNEGRWKFRERSRPAGLTAAPYYSHGAASGDYDNDGFPDLLVTGYGGLVLWHNAGDGSFLECAVDCGLSDRLWSSSAAWGDVNGDGFPDLYVAHYVDWSFANHPVCAAQQEGHARDVCVPDFDPLPDTLYFSNGDGTFRDASRDAGLRLDGKGLGVVIADLDLDGDLDVYVGNDDTAGNFLYRNSGSGRLEETGAVGGAAFGMHGRPEGSMGVDVGDYSRDGLPDIWVTNFERQTSALYRNLGGLLFQYASEPTGVAGVGGMYVGWGNVFADLDGDGDDDMAIANGHVLQFPSYSPVCQRPLLFENRDGARFVNVAPTAGDYFAAPHRGRGVAWADFNRDGAPDLAVSHVNEPVALLANQGGDFNPPRWIAVSLIGTSAAREPIGSIARLVSRGKPQVRQVKGGGSYASTSEKRLYFRLDEGDQTGSVDVTWPGGGTVRINSVPAGACVTVVEGRTGGSLHQVAATSSSP